ncbi:hypothetical protein ACIBK8_29415 [Streptomyces sp. NPDC050161]|uniref:hypothetical protein n=1 Tax=Streptomyces sp. NPDC050161 TaxID=3365604 RepID=UPI00378F54FD
MTDHFARWGALPPDRYMTRTQLADLDQPREPGGPVRATVEGRDGAGRRATFDLYLISESRPTRAGAAQLASDAARRATGTRVCEQCGARPDLPCTRVGDWLLCRTCAHIDMLRARQKQAAEARTRATAYAAELLADERLAVLHVGYTDHGATPADTLSGPSTAHLTALDADSQVLLDLQMRLVPPRSTDIPDGAIDPATATEQIRLAFTGRLMLVWAADSLGDLSRSPALDNVTWPFPTGYGRRHELCHLATDWRGDLDPKTGQPRPAIPPGRADRMLHLLQRIAGTADHYLGQAPPANRK